MSTHPKSRLQPWLVVALFAAIVFCVAGITTLVARSSDPAPVSSGTASPGTSVGTATATASKAVGKQLAPKPKPAAPTIAGDDLVHVGDDIPPGVYRAATKIVADGAAGCYWMKSSDAEGSKIIDNAMVQGGRPQVTLKKGQWFTSQGCPEWRKK